MEHASAAPAPAEHALRRVLRRLAEPVVLLPAFAVLLLGLIWGMTLHLVAVERGMAQRAAIESTRELLETYEAQVVRALREIDQTLRILAYAVERGDTSLSELRDRGLLPPEILFAVTVENAAGELVASTHPTSMGRVPDPESFEAALRSDELSVGRPRRSESSEWILDFRRRLAAPDGSVAGVATISVDASHFVSGYESSKLGEQGYLGILGMDGVFRAERSGPSVSAGDAVDYGALVADQDAERPAVVLTRNPWDLTTRYTAARQLYEFPLAVVVGLSESEQQAPVQRRMRIYLWCASAASGVVITMAVALGRASWQLARSRRREIEAQLAYAERVEYLAYHDGLTGLANRSLFAKLLAQGIEQARRYDRQIALLFVDLDRFKQVNDTLGHDAGDELLKEVARRITSCLRSSDTVARLGGDEFVVLLPEVTELRHVATVAQNMLMATGEPFPLKGQEVGITASIGIAVYPQDGEDEETLTKNADVAMYQAKLAGKNNFQFYAEAFDADAVQRFALEASLRGALERGEFRIHYQAKRDLSDGGIRGVESLLRWQHPELGLIPPVQFIPIAEETGLIVPIGRWALATACAQSVTWRKDGISHGDMSVNLTARQFFDEDLVSDIAAVLAETGLEPVRLELEISETVLLRSVERAAKTLAQLKALGVRIAVDNFGVGYSSLASVQRFPVDTIKIDRSFIRRIGDPGVEPRLTDSIVAMGKSLSLSVIAQGVETMAQAQFLRAHGCDTCQGFYFDHPIPADEFTQLVRAQAHGAAQSAAGT